MKETVLIPSPIIVHNAPHKIEGSDEYIREVTNILPLDV